MFLEKLALHVEAKPSHHGEGLETVFSRCVIRGREKGEVGDFFQSSRSSQAVC